MEFLHNEETKMSTVSATSRVQEIRNRTDAIQQKNAEKSQGTANAGQAGVSTAKSTARTSNTDTVSISTRSNSSSYAGQYKDIILITNKSADKKSAQKPYTQVFA